MIYAWEGSRQHRAVIQDAINRQADPHEAVARKFNILRPDAKRANFRVLYGN